MTKKKDSAPILSTRRETNATHLHTHKPVHRMQQAQLVYMSVHRMQQVQLVYISMHRMQQAQLVLHVRASNATSPNCLHVLASNGYGCSGEREGEMLCTTVSTLST